jgi:hypothetical protein
MEHKVLLTDARAFYMAPESEIRGFLKEVT